MEAVAEEQNQPMVQEGSFTPSTYEDHVSLDEMGQRIVPEEIEEAYEEHQRMNRDRTSDVEPGTPDSTEERTEAHRSYPNW